MTLGTAIVVSIGILCVTFITVCIIGAGMTIKNQNNAKKSLEDISSKIIANRNKR